MIHKPVESNKAGVDAWVAVCVAPGRRQAKVRNNMASIALLSRLKGIQQQLVGGYTGGAGMSSATKGNERELFVSNFLSRVFPPVFRFGTGDVIDSEGHRSGQMDVVVEYPFLPSLPQIGSEPRLYLAESVAAVIEVKSDLASQWSEVTRTADALSTVRRSIGGTITSFTAPPGPSIPLYAVGYRGWSRAETAAKHLASGTVVGSLIVDPGVYVGRIGSSEQPESALWRFICDLHYQMRGLLSVASQPEQYVIP